MKNDNILVAIYCITYNQEKFIRQTLDGFVMQKTNFPFVAVVHDDASTDHTADIIREYQEKYPEIIKPIYETENQWSKGFGRLDIIMEEAIESYHPKYIASCEGDDYWIMDNKLQLQVNFLESHPNVVYTCHRYEAISDYDKNVHFLAPDRFFDKHPDASAYIFSQEYPFFCEWVTKTLTSMYRANVVDRSYTKMFKYSRDLHFVYYILEKGNGACLNFVGGVYRRNSGGIVSGVDKAHQYEIGYKVYKEFYDVTKNKIFKSRYKRYNTLYILGSMKKRIPSNINELNAIFNNLKFYINIELKKIFRNNNELYIVNSENAHGL